MKFLTPIALVAFFLAGIATAQQTTDDGNAVTLRRRELQEIGGLKFDDVHREASANGLKAAEQILANVNKRLGDSDGGRKADGDTVLDLAKKLAAGETTSADPRLQRIMTALGEALKELFPGQSAKEVVTKLLPEIPSK